MAALSPFDRRRIADAIEKFLPFQPLVETRNRKELNVAEGVLPFEHVLPEWEIRVGELRVYYDANTDEKIVTIRAVRRKPPHRTTKDSLS